MERWPGLGSPQHRGLNPAPLECAPQGEATSSTAPERGLGVSAQCGQRSQILPMSPEESGRDWANDGSPEWLWLLAEGMLSAGYRAWGWNLRQRKPKEGNAARREDSGSAWPPEMPPRTTAPDRSTPLPSAPRLNPGWPEIHTTEGQRNNVVTAPRPSLHKD